MSAATAVAVATVAVATVADEPAGGVAAGD
eukprot:COSAG02_NODE_21872_length_772_cov_0.814264_2_plen_29_part_01